MFELREEFDEVRGTAEAKEYARALPLLETSLPADLWQLHFGDIDPTPVDLVLRRVKMSPPEGVAGQKMTFSAEIANSGTGAAAAFIVQLKIDGRVLGAVSLPGLARGASATVDFPPWPAVPGTHTARVMADASARIAEPAEGNNVRNRRVVVPR